MTNPARSPCFPLVTERCAGGGKLGPDACFRLKDCVLHAVSVQSIEVIPIQYTRADYSLNDNTKYLASGMDGHGDLSRRDSASTSGCFRVTGLDSCPHTLVSGRWAGASLGRPRVHNRLSASVHGGVVGHIRHHELGHPCTGMSNGAARPRGLRLTPRGQPP